MDDAQVGSEGGRCRYRCDETLVEDARPWLPPNARSVRGVARRTALQAGKAAPDRVARDDALAREVAEGFGPRARGVTHDSSEDAVREPRSRVGFEDHGAHPQECRSETNRPAGISADAQHGNGSQTPHQGGRAEETTRQGQESEDESFRSDAVERQDRAEARDHSPPSGTRRPSSPLGVPAKTTFTSPSRRRSSSATAIPGKRCPPVPPAAIRKVRAMVSPRAGRCSTRGPRRPA